MLHLVDAGGKYHGDVATLEEAKAHVAKQKMNGIRALSDAEWEQAKNATNRAELFATLGSLV